MSATEICDLCPNYENCIRYDCEKIKNYSFYSSDDTAREEYLKILYKIWILLSYTSTAKLSKVAMYTGKYLTRHPTIPATLTMLLKVSRNTKEFSYALDILSKLINKNSIVNDSDRETLFVHFRQPDIFKNFLGSLRLSYKRYTSDKNDLRHEQLRKVMKTMVTLYLKNHGNFISELPQEDVHFLLDLLEAASNDKGLATLAQQIVKIYCCNAKNCQPVCSENFAKSLCKAFYTSGRISLTVSIFKIIIQNSFSLENISQSESLFDLIIQQLHIKDNKPQIQKNLMIILYRITATDKGVKIMSSEEYWNALLQYFLQNDDRCRMTKIKAFTILNRSIPKRNLPCEPDFYSINYSENVLKELQNSNCFECSLNEDIDESEDDEENFDTDSYDSKDFEEDVESENIDLNIEIHKSELPKHKLEPFFSELLAPDGCTNKTNNLEILKKLENYLNKNSKSQPSPSTVYKYLFSQTERHIFTKSVSYPDSMLVEADLSDSNQTICVSTSKQLTKTLAGKLCRLKFEPPRVYPSVYFVEQDNEGSSEGYSSMEALSIIDNHHLKFSSTFEGGNLRHAERVSQYEYNLMVTGDYKTENFSQWFYFSVTNMEAGKPYTFNIINFKRINSQFNHGMQPVMFSVKDFLRKGIGWKRTGKNIIYYGNNFRSKTNSKQYRTLSFCITFNNSKDTCFIAYHYPYTYTRLLTNIYLNYQKLVEETIYVRVDKLCDTIKSNEVPLITVTSKSSLKELQKRPIVFITGRVHPGESNSSWIIQGILDFLLNEHDEKAAQARNNYIFKIIPMLNPEGVILGQSRNGITGEDLNRCYKNPNPILHPEIYYLKSIVGYAVKVLQHPVATFVDIHGHSRKKFFFFYGCDPKKSWNSTDRKQMDCSDICTLLPTYINNNNLNKSFCRYDFNSEKESTCRVMMWREFGIKCSYTLESSFCSGENKKKITTETLQQIGISLVTALAFIAQQKIWQKKKVFDE